MQYLKLFFWLCFFVPDGKTHTKATLMLSVAVLILFRPIEIALLLFFGCLIGTVITPDLDVDTGHYGFHIVRKRFGRFIGGLWAIYWWPYRKIVPHRHAVSHFPLVSTFLRFTYLFLPIFLLFPTILGLNSPNLLEFWGFWVFLGTVLADCLHTVMDLLSSYFKRILT